MGEEAPLAGVPNLALRAERAPNGRGAELLGYSRDYASALAAAETAAVVLVLDEPDIAVRTAGEGCKSTPLYSRPLVISYSDFCLEKNNAHSREGNESTTCITVRVIVT